VEASRWGKAALRIVTALVKARVKQALGEEALRAAADELADLGQEELAARLEAFLAAEDRRAALAKALQRADACARQRLASTPWHGPARQLPLRDLPSLLQALEDLPQDDLDETRLHAALAQVLERDWRATPEQARHLADLYRRKLISYELALSRAVDPKEFTRLAGVGAGGGVPGGATAPRRR